MDAISQAVEAVHNRLQKIECRFDEPMKNHTSFKIGGPVRAMFFPDSAALLGELIAILDGYGVIPLVMGNGTNLLADDVALDLVVVNTTGLNSIDLIDDSVIRAGAGVALSRLAVFACECGLSGLEFSHGIPGTLGGAVSMNAGAYDAEMADVVSSTMVLGAKTGVVAVSGAEQGFSYRHSRFSKSGEIILSSDIRLRRGDPVSIGAKMAELNDRRRESQPLDLASAGSTFKRPGVGYAAELIEQAGLKGFEYGGAQVSEKHSGFIVNRGGASFSDVMAVIDHVRETVLKQFGIELELEVKIVSNYEL